MKVRLVGLLKEDLDWSGLDFDPEKWDELMSINTEKFTNANIKARGVVSTIVGVFTKGNAI